MNRVISRLGIATVAILSLLPLIFWVGIRPLSERFSSLPISLGNLGDATALVGTAMFALTLILSGRYKVLEKYFGGLDKLYVAHHAFGGISFILLLFHPLFLSFQYAFTSIKTAFLILLPSGNFVGDAGIFSLIIMIGALSLTFYTKLPYELWRLSHKFLGLAFFLGAIHGLFNENEVSRDPMLFWYLLTLSIVGIVVFFCHSLFYRFFVRRTEFSVDEVNPLNGDVTEIVLKPMSNSISFQPGQFAFVELNCGGRISEVHPFSISSAPADPRLRFAIKSLGDYTKKVQYACVGSKAKVEGPFGGFIYTRARSKRQIWIAGGVGVTPFLSMVRCVPGPDYSIDFFYTTQKADEVIYKTELEAAASSQFRLHLWPTEEKGRITAAAVTELAGDLKGADIYICGPVPMMRALANQCTALGVRRGRIHTEEFQLT
ncbi:ferric reductase-like transmembrane domain-containing protein [Candidatus Gracilibacteria bacterium]|nr:ferric reductase-like transmembrane domain-containing protein [Candidatus Gracilibacteria bacterium]